MAILQRFYCIPTFTNEIESDKRFIHQNVYFFQLRQKNKSPVSSYPNILGPTKIVLKPCGIFKSFLDFLTDFLKSYYSVNKQMRKLFMKLEWIFFFLQLYL